MLSSPRRCGCKAPNVLIVTPFGRFRGWDSVKNNIYPSTRTAFPERLLQASDVSLVVSGDVAWLVYDFVFSGKRVNREPFRFTGWESHGYQRTSTGWRIAHLHYSLPAPNPDGDVASASTNNTAHRARAAPQDQEVHDRRESAEALFFLFSPSSKPALGYNIVRAGDFARPPGDLTPRLERFEGLYPELCSSARMS